MRTLFSTIALMAMMSLLVGCDSDEPKSETVSMQILYHRVIDTDQPQSTPFFSQSTCKFTMRSQNTRTLQGNIVLKLDEDTQVEFATDLMTLTPAVGEYYSYNFTSQPLTAGGHTITNIVGKVSLAGPFFMEYYVDDRYHCYTTLQPYYAHTTTGIHRTSVSGDTDYSTTDITYAMTLDAATMKGTLHLFGFHLAAGTGSNYAIQYRDLTVLVTPDGYRLTGEAITPYRLYNEADQGELSEQYTATSIDVTINKQGLALQGVITIGTEDDSYRLQLDGHFFETDF